MTGGFDNAPPSPKLVRKIRTNCYLVNGLSKHLAQFHGRLTRATVAKFKKSECP
jgi:hypothetical protein